MSGEPKKPTITRAGKKPEATPVVEKKMSRSEKRKEAKKLKAQMKTDQKLEKDIKKVAAIASRAKKKEKPKQQSSQGSAPQATEVKPEVTKGTTLAKASKKSKKQAKKDKKKSKKTLKAKKTRSAKRLPRKSRLAMAGAMAAVLLLVGYGIAKDEPVGFVSSDSITSGLLGESDTTDDGNKPDFVRVVPRTSAGDLRSHYDPDRGFFTFQEEFYSKLITVNQQPIPSDFILSADVILAQTEYSSVGRFESDKGVVYVARSDTGSQQAVAFVFNNLLIFITTTQDVADGQWLEYINSL